MTNLEDYENFKKNHQSRKVYDVQSLLSVGETMQFYQEQTMGDRAMNVGKSVYNGIAGIARGTLRGLQAIRDTTELEMNRLNPDRMQMDEDFREALDSAADAEMLKPYEVRADSGAEQFVYDLAQGAGQLAGQAAISLLPGGAVLSPAAMALQIGGEEYHSLREQGVDVETAGRAAAFNAAVQTPLESIGLSRIMRRLPANTLLWQRVRHTAENALTEGITEFLQEFPERASEIWALEHAGEPPKDAAEMAAEIAKTAFDHFGEIAPGAAYSGVIGWFLGGGASGLHIAADRALGGHIERAMQREAHNAMMEHANETANRIKESGINPQYAAIVTNDNTQNATVYVDGMTLQGYAQEAGMEKVAESLGVTVEEIEKAAANGDTVDVKLGNFEATGAAFDGFFQAVQDDTAFEDGGYTPNKEKYERDILKQAKEQDDEFRAAQDELIGEIRRAGAKNEEAIHATAILSAWARNQENPLEALKSVPRYVFGGDGSAATGNLAQSMFDVRKAGAKSVLDLKNRMFASDENKKDPNKVMFTGDNGITYAGAEVAHSINKHGLTDEDLLEIEKNGANLQNAHLSNWKKYVGKYHGKVVIGRIDGGNDTSYYVAYEFAPNGEVWFKTAAKGSKEGIDKKIEELGAESLSLETSAGTDGRVSSIAIIKEQLAKVNAEEQRYHQEVASQKEEVRKKYEGTDQWMKAPNGEPTNLTEDQWLTVRTEAFKNWFGDWENDPENASKVVDENGEPLVVYHWTNNVFDTFRSGNMAKTIYFSESKKGARKAARGKRNVLECFLNVKNPVNEKTDPVHWYDAEESLNVYKWKKDGRDGVFVRDEAGTSIAVFEPTQIKSATDNNGQFDAGDPNIYHQFAGNVDNPGENMQNKSAETVGAGVVVKGDEFGQYKDIKELRTKALQYYADKLQGTSVENKVLGSVNIDRNGIVNFTRSGKGELKNSSAKEHKLLLVKYLPDLIRDATNITDKPSEKPTHKKEHFYYLHTQASVEGKTIPVDITLIRRNNGEIQYYNHILPSEENKKDVVVSTEPVPGTPAYGPPSIPTSFGNQNIPRNRGNVNGKTNNVKANESRSENQGGFSDGQIFEQAAWHGTPHIFQSFDLGAIGTGEGAQAHGWGLYFAQDREVSERYKNSLSMFAPPISKVTVDGKQYTWNSAKETWEDENGSIPAANSYALVIYELYGDGNNKSRAIDYLKTEIEDVKAFPDLKESGGHFSEAELEQAIQFLQKSDIGKFTKEENNGSLFQVEIPDDDVLLDEQKTFAEQPEKVRAALRRLVSRLTDAQLDNAVSGRLNQMGRNAAKRELMEFILQSNGREIYYRFPTILGDQRKTSMAFNRVGIKGITYEGGRDGRCFVVFDDKAIEIINAYNKKVNGEVKGNYNPETNIITLFKGADASTVIHETWHFFVEQMWRSVEDGSASAQTAKDFDTLLSYAGMTREAWAASDANGRRAAHEKLAEAGETYIMEGKAPSMELRGVFEKFAQWLKDVYRTISRSGNAAELTDEVREVFDRMLAAEDDIARMERVNGYFAKLPPVITEGMSDATKRRVEDFIEKARGKAVDILTRRALRNYTKKKRETVKNIRAELKPQIEEEVGKRPVYACGYDKKDAKKYRRLTGKQESEHQIAQTAQALQEIVNGKEEASVPNLRPDLAEYGGSPDLTFVWGDQKKGLMHIGVRHGGEVIEHVIDTVLYGDVARFAETKKTVTLSHNGYEAILSLDEHGKKKTWLLTGWQKNTPDAAGEVSAQSGATQTAPTFSRRDLGAGLSDYITDLKKRKGRESLKDDEAAFLLEAELTAEQYGYSGADEMMKDVESAPPKSEAVSRRVREMTEELADDGGMEGREEAIRESIYNEDEALLIAAEQWIIESYATKARERQEAQEQRKAETKARRRERQEQQKAETAAEQEARKEQEKQEFSASAEMAAALRQQARNVAKADLAKMNIFEATRTSRFVAAERRAAMRSAELLAKEEYAAAAQQKNLQAYWHAMAAESINIKRRKEQYEKFIKTQTRLKKESWLNDTHFAAVSQLFARMGIAGQKHREAAESARFKNLAEYAEKMSERFDCVDIADWILEEETDISDTKALTLDQYEDVVNAIKNIKAIVKAQKGVNMFSTGEAFTGMKQKILGLLKPLPVRFNPNPNKPTRPTAMEKWQASMENTDTLFEMMDDSSYGFFSKVWGNVIKRAADHEYECLEKYNKADADALKKWLPDKTAEAAAGEEVFYEELGTSVTKHTLVKMLINLGNADNAQRLCETVPVGFEKNSLWIFPDDEGSRYAAMEMTRQNLIHFLGRVLTKEDVEYAQRKIDAAEMFWGEKNDLEKRVKGFGLKKVQPTPVLLRINGENVILKGGYFPLMRNGETGSHSVAGEVQDDEELQGRRIRTYHTNTSATKKRTQARYPVNLFPGAETQCKTTAFRRLWTRPTSGTRTCLCPSIATPRTPRRRARRPSAITIPPRAGGWPSASSASSWTRCPLWTVA